MHLIWALRHDYLVAAFVPSSFFLSFTSPRTVEGFGSQWVGFVSVVGESVGLSSDSFSAAASSPLNCNKHPNAPKYPSCSRNRPFIVPFDQNSIAYASSFIEMGFTRRKLPTNTTFTTKKNNRLGWAFNGHQVYTHPVDLFVQCAHSRNWANVVGNGDKCRISQIFPANWATFVIYVHLSKAKWNG